MASQEGCVTVKWDIRNFSLFLKTKARQHFLSPKMELEDTEGRAREVYLIVCHSDLKIVFRANGFGGDRTEMFFMSSNGDVLIKADPSSLLKSALFDKNSKSILLNDTMTLCYRTWGKTIKTSEFHIATVLKNLNHLCTIEEMAVFDSHDIYIEQENVKLPVSLKKLNDEDISWLVEPQAPLDLFILDCTLSMKSSCGSVSNYIRWLYPENSFLFCSRSSKITGVTLQLEFIVAHNEKYELSASSQVVRETPLEPNSKTNTARHKNVSGALGDDFLLLYRDSAFSDATLNTEGKSFTAHRNVLAARSPVFRAMLERDETSEGRSGVVDIDDVDSETVDRMLVYLYSDSVGDLPWKEASALYYAADKYEIPPLKEKCADFLKNSLTADNACDVLVLADRHSDQELMTVIVDFILGHEEVVSSAKWGELEKGNPMLCAKITRQLFLKKGKK